MTRPIEFRLIKDGKIVGYERHVLNKQCGESRPNVVCIEHSRDGKEWWCIWFSKDYFIDHDNKEQFTGLLDKNGVKVFEGDIVYYSIVCYSLDGTEAEHSIHVIEDFGIDCRARLVKKTGIHWPPQHLSHLPMNCCNVIGNIHQNPELLK